MMLRYEVAAHYTKPYDPPRGFPGLALRGALGHALHTLYCTRPSHKCTACPRYTKCPYALLYETTPATDKSGDIALAQQAVTNPYTLEVLYSGEKGIGFALNLFGDATSHYREALTALLYAATLGIGYSKRHAERRRLSVERITQEIPLHRTRTIVYKDGAVHTDALPRRPPRSLLASFAPQAKKIYEDEPSLLEIEFKAPYRLSNPQQAYTPSYRHLLMTIARRYSLLAAYHKAGRRLTLRDARSLAALADTVQTLEAVHGPLIKVTKRSIVTGEKKGYGLFATHGRILYRLPPDYWKHPLAPLSAALIMAGQYLHAGKLATAGYGRYIARFYV